MKYRLVVMGGSAGSLDAILSIVTRLPADTRAAFVIVVHRKNSQDSILENLLSTRSNMKVKEVEDKESILPNFIYIAPADYHLLIEDRQTFSLDSSEKVHYSRPSIDVTLESAVTVFGADIIAVLLSGANADGSEGLKQVKEAGGFVIVQDPLSAQVNYMPQHALNKVAPQVVAHADAIADLLTNLLRNEGV